MDYSQYLPTLAACDIDTICIGFSNELLEDLYKVYVNQRLPKSYSKPGLAVKVKELADLIISATEKMKGMNINSKKELGRVINLCKGAEGLYQRYDSDTLYLMYLFVYNHKPLSAQRAKDYANALWHYYSGIARAEALLGRGQDK